MALLLGYAVAHEAWWFVALLPVAALWLVTRLGPQVALLGAGLLVGYLDGNRGFAQLS